MDLLRSLPIGLYLETPVTWLHKTDPRIKLGWLVSILLSPIAANSAWRLSIVGFLIVLTFILRIPGRVWRRQLGLLAAFSLLLFGITTIAPDGLNVSYTPRLPAQDLTFNRVRSPDAPPEPADEALANLPQPTSYRSILVQQPLLRMGNRQVLLQVTQRSLDLAVRIGSLTFILLYSSTLYLLTTAPEEIAAAFEYLAQPLKRLGVPVTEIVLTLTLSLRFIPLVLEEVQNLVRAVRTRGINWKKLGFRGSAQVWLTVAERFLENLLLRAEQIASAMLVRGFVGANQHQVRWYEFRLQLRDGIIMVGILAFWGLRIYWGGRG
ncbi:MAG: energy-coupling factor transporter transmembrane protein EcfT [Elainellaceae cyanobacterium]